MPCAKLRELEVVIDLQLISNGVFPLCLFVAINYLKTLTKYTVVVMACRCNHLFRPNFSIFY